MTAAQPRQPSGHVEVTVTDARARLPELIDTGVRDGGVVYLTRYSRRVGAVVPAEVAEQFEQWEDVYWSQRAAELLDNALRANVAIGVETLRGLQPIVAPAVKRGQVKVVGAMYDLRTGSVSLTG